MWMNRITLDYVKHNDARIKIKEMLDKKGITDECITNLNISADNGYVIYVVILSDGSCFKVFDDGSKV